MKCLESPDGVRSQTQNNKNVIGELVSKIITGSPQHLNGKCGNILFFNGRTAIAEAIIGLLFVFKVQRIELYWCAVLRSVPPF